MLKDITLGQFFPGNSIIHKLDPRAKIILVFLMMITFFTMSGLYSYLLASIFIIFIVNVSKISKKTIIKSLKPLVFILCFTSFLNIFYTQGTPIFEFWIFKPTYEGLKISFFMVWRLILLVAGTSLITYTTSPIMLTDAIERLMKPLKLFKVPTHDFAMMMTIALRFIPTLIEETEKIINAQKARGADFESGNLVSRAKSLIPILIPLFVSSLRRADDLAIAMECRLYRGDIGRTRLKVLKYTFTDFATFLVCILIFGAIILI